MRSKFLWIIFLVVCIIICEVYWFSVSQKTPSLINIGVLHNEPQGNEVRRNFVAVDDCSIDIPTHLIDDNSIDFENGTIEVRWFDGVKQENVKRIFRYKPNNGFVGCSSSVKSKLEEAYQAEQDRLKELRQQCPYFEAIVKGGEPLPEKGGEQARMRGAIDFVSQYCK